MRVGRLVGWLVGWLAARGRDSSHSLLGAGLLISDAGYSGVLQMRNITHIRPHHKHNFTTSAAHAILAHKNDMDFSYYKGKSFEFTEYWNIVFLELFSVRNQY